MELCLGRNRLFMIKKLFSPSKPCSATFRTYGTRQPGRRSNVSTAAAVDLITCSSSSSGKLHDDQISNRRTANYQPPTWKYGDIQSLDVVFVGESDRKRASQLKEEIIVKLNRNNGTLDLLELIDDVQRLGLSYHFKNHIKQVLETIYSKCSSDLRFNGNNLYATSLYFRLLRQHGFNVSQDIFSCFLSEDGEIKCSLRQDTKGMLYLYEACHLLVEGESTLELVLKSATQHLKKNLDDGKLDEDLGVLVRHALDLPPHWRMPRLQTRWFIDIYQTRPDMNPTLLEFAKLDFNMVQAQHLQGLKDASRWWQGTGLAEELTFARDRIVECFFWTIGLIFEPPYEYFRHTMTKVNAFITIVDDIYDVYGTLDELQLFTDAIERWDINGIEHLPDYMKVCLLQLFNYIDDMVYEAHKEPCFQIHTAACLRRSWGDLCKAYLREAKWYFNGHTPTLEEYLNNAWISVGGSLILTHAYFLVTSPFDEEALQGLQNCHNLIRWSSTIVRLSDDLATSWDEMQRGDVSKSIQCYMNEANTCEEKARQHIKFLMEEIWKKMNKECLSNWAISETYIEIVMNFARAAQCIYEHGDGHGHQNVEAKDRIYKLLFHPIPLP